MKLTKFWPGLLVGAVSSILVGLYAQTGTGVQGTGVQGGGGGGTPAGSNFSTQYNNAGALGGTGPGSSGNVLTSRGASLSPTYQAVDLANVTGNLAVSHLNSGTGASASTFWRGDGTWVAAGATPAGSTTQVQFNDGGSFGADAGLTYAKSTDTLTLGVGGGTPTAGIITGATGSSTTTVKGPDGALGQLSLLGGDGSVAGGFDGGPVLIQGGLGNFAANGAGGRVELRGGTPGNNFVAGGSILILGTSGGSLNGAGGSITLQAGAGPADPANLNGFINFNCANATTCARLHRITKYFEVVTGGALITTQSARVGGVTYHSVSTVGNTAATPTNAYSHSVTANTLAADGESLEFESSGTFAGTLSVDKQVTAVWGGTTILDSGPLAINSGSWIIRGTIIRTGAATQKVFATLETSNATTQAVANYTTATETLSGAVTLKLTLNGTNANDTVAEVYKENWQPAGP